MIELKWLIEDYIEPESTQKLCDTVAKHGYKFVNTKQIVGSVEDYFEEEDCVIASCTIATAGDIFYKKKWIPGVFTNFKEYQCSQYYPLLSKYLLNEDYIMLSYGDLLRKKDFIFQTIGSSDTVFIRPNSGFKTFTGQVLYKERFEKDIGNLGYGAINPSEICVIASPVNIAREWRFFASKEGIITGSLYRENDEKCLSPDYPSEAKELANEIAKSDCYTPDPVYSIDICEDRKGNFYLLELGCFSCSGLYACDLDPLVEVVSQKAIEAYKDLYES